MGSIGKLETFDESQNDWTTYVERMNNYFAVNKIEQELFVPALLSLLGGKTFALLRDLTAPVSPSTKTYDQLVSILGEHLSPKPLMIAERFRFYKRNQGEGESVLQFVAELKRLTQYCEFGQSLNDYIRDRLVCGLRCESYQERLLTEPELTLQRAIDIAVSMESAAKEAEELSGNNQHVKRLNTHYSKNQTYKSQVPNHNIEKKTSTCRRCNTPGHAADNCRFKNAICRRCGKTGHIQWACLSVKKGNSSQEETHKTRFVNKDSTWPKKKGFSFHKDKTVKQCEFEDSSVLSFGINGLQLPGFKPYIVSLLCNGKLIHMELDTGAAVSIMSEVDFKKLPIQRTKPMKETSVRLRTYTGEKILPLGEAEVEIEYGGKKLNLPILIVEQFGPPLIGRNWLTEININLDTIKNLTSSDGSYHSNEVKEALKDMLKKHSKLFDGEQGTIKGFTAKISLAEGLIPKFVKARPLPFALKQPVENELNSLVERGVLTPVETSEWATPIVPVIKKNNQVRLCGDYKTTVNPNLVVEQYPMPRAEDVFATLSGGTIFSKLDLTQAYQQLEVDQESRKCLTLSTHKGLFQQNRLPFGIASSPAIFQRTLEQIIHGLNRTVNSQDDILISGTSVKDHLLNLEKVLEKLEERNIKLNLKKCEFFVEEIEYLGHKIDAQGLHTTPDKVKAICEASTPENVTQLKSFLGLLNYYHKFLPDIATVLHPLHQLLQKDTDFVWTEEHEKCYSKAKNLIASSKVLVHYDQELPLLLACDASSYGLGVVLSHKFVDGSERPIAFASRSLSKSEKNYAQIDKEALSIVFGLKKFHQYLYGRHFTLITDHKPLTAIFSPTAGIPTLATARLQRWALQLSAHDYEVRFRKSSEHCNADALSRLPLIDEDNEEEEEESVDILYAKYWEPLPVDYHQIAKETARDSVLSVVSRNLLAGWNSNSDPVLAPYFLRRNEMSLQNGCIVWGMRVVVPLSLQRRVLEELHRSHSGQVRMKEIARSYVWWSQLDSMIEQVSKTCLHCLEHQANPTSAPLHPWVWPTKPWLRIHADFAGPLEGVMFLVIVDAHSKWPEVFQLKTTTAEATIKCFREVFGRWGLPDQLVTDNGPQFRSEEFSHFLKSNGIKQTFTAPYHPASNGQAERFVRTLKQSIRKSSGATLDQRLADFLLCYRNTKHATTQCSPAELMLKRSLKTRLDLLRPNVESTVIKQQDKQIQLRDTPRAQRSLTIGDKVYAKSFSSGKKWFPATIQKQSGPVSFVVCPSPGKFIRRHQDQLIRVTDPIPNANQMPVTDRRISMNKSPAILPQQIRRSERIRRSPKRLGIN